MSRVDQGQRHAVAGSGRARRAVATVVAEVFSPLVVVTGLVLVVGAASHERPLVGLGWGVLAACFVGAVPYAFLLRGVRRGRWSSRHLPQREQRTVPFLFAALSGLLGVVLLVVGGAPRALAALVVTGLVGLGVTIAVTRRWKMSVHTAVASATATVLTILFGPAALASWAVVPVVGWARLVLRAHTRGEVVAGAVIGAAVAALVQPLSG